MYNIKRAIKILSGIAIFCYILSYKCNVSASDAAQPETLYDHISKEAVLDAISSTYATNSTGINFSAISSDTNGKGIYTFHSTSDEKFPVHYYRGNVTDNNVLFGNYCWKIVRTTTTGGVKLIYNGIPTDGKCDNSGKQSQIGTSKYNEHNYSPEYTGYMYEEIYETKIRYGDATGLIYYGNDVTYDDTTGLYTLVDYISANSLIEKKEEISKKYHYLCPNREISCKDPRYIYTFQGDDALVIILKNGDKIEDAVAKNTYNSSNVNDSTAKQFVESWYQENLISFTDYLEDTIWCNDRTIYQYAGWDKNTAVGEKLLFSSYERLFKTPAPSIQCSQNDAFTVNKNIGNGKLTYPIGLITGDELILAGAKVGPSNTNQNYYLYTGEKYWTLSSYGTSGDGNAYCGQFYESNGHINAGYTTKEFGIRPMISLKHATFILEGDGTVDNPYVIENGYHVNLAKMVNGKVKASKTYVKENDIISLNTTPDLGYKLKSISVIDEDNNEITVSNNAFVMPNKNVTVNVNFEAISYIFVEGQNEIYQNKDLTFKVNGEYSLFDKLYIQNQEVPNEYYTIKEGSTIITLKKEYLDTLDGGSYTITVTYKNGSSESTSFSINKNSSSVKNPQTEDGIIKYIISFIVSITSIAGIIFIKQKEEKEII